MIRFFLLLFLFSNYSFALKYERDDLRDLYHKSKSVEQIKILGATQVTSNIDGKLYSCGYEYEYELIESLKSKGIRKTSFITMDGLRIGDEYLVFFSENHLGAYFLYMTMGRDDSSVYQACSSVGEGSFSSSINGGLLQFDEIWFLTTGERMLKVIPETVELPKSIKVKSVELKNDSLPAEFIESSSYKGVLWDDIRQYLKRQ